MAPRLRSKTSPERPAFAHYVALGGSPDPEPDQPCAFYDAAHRVDRLLMGGQACVSYRAAETPRTKDMAFRYTNRKGKSYYLHGHETRGRRVRYVFARRIGDGALDEIPPGYEVRENINGQVTLGKVRPRLISEVEERAVRSELARLSLDGYRCPRRVAAGRAG